MLTQQRLCCCKKNYIMIWLLHAIKCGNKRIKTLISTELLSVFSHILHNKPQWPRINLDKPHSWSASQEMPRILWNLLYIALISALSTDARWYAMQPVASGTGFPSCQQWALSCVWRIPNAWHISGSDLLSSLHSMWYYSHNYPQISLNINSASNMTVLLHNFLTATLYTK